MPRPEFPSEEFEAGWDKGVQDTLSSLEGFMKAWEDAVGEELDPLVAVQLSEHRTPAVLVSILAEYWSYWEWGGDELPPQPCPFCKATGKAEDAVCGPCMGAGTIGKLPRWMRFGNPKYTNELQRLMEMMFIQPLRLKLLALQKIIVQIPTALEQPPRDPAELREWMKTHARRVTME